MNAPDLHTRILAAPAAAAAGERPLVDSFRVLAAHDRAVCGGELCNHSQRPGAASAPTATSPSAPAASST
jgi:hypothetical protein